MIGQQNVHVQLMNIPYITTVTSEVRGKKSSILEMDKQQKA